MDYPAWELERQRAVLAALLLGGGRAEEDGGETPEEAEARAARRRKAADRSWGMEAGLPDAGVRERREARFPGAWEAGRRTGRVFRRPPFPAGAWEEITGAELPGEGEWEQDGLRPAAAPEAESPGSGTEVREVVREVLQGLSEALEERGALGRRPVFLRESAGRPGQDSGGGEMPPFPAEAGDGEAPGRAVSFRRAEWAGTDRRRGGAFGEALKRGIPSFSQETEADGAMVWRGGREAAPFRAEDGARAVSRAVQRDSRRYDGGFVLY
ncbi:hypothetical protein AALC17_07760 [Oscillospiraceae bacterium 38-13]